MRSATSPLEPFGNSEITRFESHWTKYDKIWQNMAKYGKNMATYDKYIYIYIIIYIYISSNFDPNMLSRIEQHTAYMQIHWDSSKASPWVRDSHGMSLSLTTPTHCQVTVAAVQIFFCATSSRAQLQFAHAAAFPCIWSCMKLYVCTPALLSPSASSTQLNTAQLWFLWWSDDWWLGRSWILPLSSLLTP